MKNIILMSDSYKYSHPWQYPKDTTYLHSYLESRGGTENSVLLPAVKFFGLQYLIKEYLTIKVTKEMVEEAKEVLQLHGVPFDHAGWMRIVNHHQGNIPLKIRAVPEGSFIPRRNVLMTIESTDEELFWLVGWAETLLMKVWYPTTVATLSYNIYQMIQDFMNQTCDNLDKLPFMLHDFGYRGAASEESGSLGGLAHLTNFSGTDTIGAIMYGRKYYHSTMSGFSIPATEHSTITAWGSDSTSEKMAFEHIIEMFAPNYPLFACVSDSYDFLNAVDMWGELKEQITKQNSTLVIRPDSGDAKSNILMALKKLEVSYGYQINTKGYKVLQNVALIQGDGVNFNEIYDILKMMKENNYAADNIAFGMGGALLQGNEKSSVNRDTHKFAIKCSAIQKSGKIYDVFKNPVTDHGKKSKKGRLDLIINQKTKGYETVKLDASYKLGEYHKDSILTTYYENGIVYCDYKLEDIKEKNNN
ncbi:MAG: nicotinate phosphoribosyltransferase [Mycoplasmatales bacterium]